MDKITSMERAVIGGILEKTSLLPTAYELLKPEHFSDINCRKIYSAMLDLYSDDKQISEVALYRDADIDYQRLLDISGDFFSTETFDRDIKFVYESALRREGKRILERQLKGVDSGDIFEWIDETTDKVSGIAQELHAITSDRQIKDEIETTIAEVEERITSDNENVLKTDTFPSVNSMINGGFMLGNMVAISGREKDGKTAFAYRLALDFILNEIPTAIFNYEVNKRESYWRLFSYESGTDYNSFRNPRGSGVNFTEVQKDLIRKFHNTTAFVYDKSYSDVELVSKLKLIKSKYGIKVAVIDYIGLIPTTRKYETREKEVANLSRQFKQLAKELDMLLIVISQRNRQDDIAESLALQRDSDFAFVVKNPTQYDTSVIKYRGEDLVFDEGQFFIYLSHSRHSVSGGYMKAKYYEGNFVELHKITELDEPPI